MSRANDRTSDWLRCMAVGLLAGDIGRLRAARLKAGMTQTVLATRAGMAVPFLNNIEAGRLGLSPVSMLKFADAMGIEPGDLCKLGPACDEQATALAYAKALQVNPVLHLECFLWRQFVAASAKEAK